MKRLIYVLIACGSLALVCSCSDDDVDPKTDGSLLPDVGGQSDGATDNGGANLEGGTPDIMPPDTGPITPKDHNIGAGCSSKTDCKKDSPLCLQYTNLFSWVTTGAGICTASCTPDNASTPLVDEDSCPKPGYKCGAFSYSSGDINYCLKTCDPSTTKNPCDAKSGTTCHPRSTAFSGSLNQAVCIWPKCTSNKECPVTLQKACTSDGDCTGLGTGAFCYTSSSKCALPGNCSAGGICGKHTKGKSTAKVGDPCKDDTECPNNGTCFTESSSTSGAIGVDYHNGYCAIPNCTFSKTLTEYACDSGSACHALYYGGVCFKKCDLKTASSCRGYAKDNGGDYECYAWNNLVTGSGGTPVSSSALCQSAATRTCDSFGTGSTVNCTTLGLPSGNSTKMGCRDRNTGKAKSSGTDPTGVCLDDTASGTFQAAAVDAGTTTPDAGTTTPDAGTATPDAATTTPDAATATPDAGIVADQAMTE